MVVNLAVQQSMGLPAHDLIAYIAAGIAVFGCALAVIGALIAWRKVGEINSLYRTLVRYVSAEELDRITAHHHREHLAD